MTLGVRSVADDMQKSLLVVHGLPWPCGLPSPNGEVTRIIMLSTAAGHFNVACRLELPGEGDVAIMNLAEGSFLIAPPKRRTHRTEALLLHARPTSFMSYPIAFPAPPLASPVPSRPPSVPPTPQLRAISLFRSSTPTPASNREPEGIRKNRSFVSLRDAADLRPVDANKDRPFKRFIAARKAEWQSRDNRDNDPQEPESTGVGLGEGKEIEHNGDAGWKRIRFNERGEGVGWIDDAVDVGPGLAIYS